MVGRPELLSLLLHRFYIQEALPIHQRTWSALYHPEIPLTDLMKDTLKPFQKIFFFSAKEPKSLILRFEEAGIQSLIWIPSLPDTRKKIPLPFLQQKVLADLEVPWLDSRPILFPSQEDLLRGRTCLEQSGLDPGRGRPLVAIHPGSGSTSKNWPLGSFLEVASGLVEQGQRRPFFILGPVERERDPTLVEGIRRRGFVLIEGLLLPLLAGVLKACAGYLGNDSGVSHLAAVLGLPSVVLFGPTDPLLWGPSGKQVRHISASLSCAPCDQETVKGCPERKCLSILSSPEVLTAVQTIIPLLPSGG
jgi:ADP-heptose:LPS heptosyltransferase